MGEEELSISSSPGNASIGVRKPQQDLERRGLDVVHRDAARLGIRHGCHELRLEDRRAGGEHRPVRAERRRPGGGRGGSPCRRMARL
jgi:hypothetical protein